MSTTNRVFATAEAVIYATAEDAVRDLRQLRKRGMIIGDRVATDAEWPRTRSGKMAKCNGYRDRRDVAHLLAYFTDHMARHLELVGSTIDPSAALSRLGFHGRVA